MNKVNGANNSGQAMLIAVLSLGSAILGATTVAGLLTLYQLRAVNDAENSAKAIFAADSGVEWTLFDYYCGMAGRCGSGAPNVDSDLPKFTNAVTVSVRCMDVNGDTSVCSDVSSTVTAVSVGTSGSSHRAFAVQLVGATSTDP